MTPAKPEKSPATGGLDLPRVTTVQATVKAGRHGFRVAWLPSEGWFCSCTERRGGCDHVTAVLAAITGGQP